MKFTSIAIALFAAAACATGAAADGVDLGSVLRQSDAPVDAAVETIFRKYRDVGFAVATRCLDQAAALSKEGKPDPSALNCKNENLLIQPQPTAPGAAMKITAIVQAQDQTSADPKFFFALHCMAGSLGVTFAGQTPLVLRQTTATLHYRLDGGPSQTIAMDAASKGGYGLFTAGDVAARRLLGALHIGPNDTLFVDVDALPGREAHFRIMNFSEAVQDFLTVCKRLDDIGR